MGVDTLGHTADPLPQIQLVGALIQQYAAALARPSRTPIAGIVVCLGAIPIRDQPVGTANGAVLAGAHKLPHRAVNMVGALIKHHGKYHIVLLGFLVHLLHLLGIHARGFFHQHMQAVLHTSDSVLRVVIVGHCHDHSITQAAV